MPTSPTDLVLQGGRKWSLTAASSDISIELLDTEGLNPTPLLTAPAGVPTILELPAGTGEAPLFGGRKIILTGASDFTIAKKTASLSGSSTVETSLEAGQINVSVKIPAGYSASDYAGSQATPDGVEISDSHTATASQINVKLSTSPETSGTHTLKTIFLKS